MDIQRQFNGDAIRQELLKQYNRATTTSTDDVDLLAIDLFATMVQQYEAFITFDATKIIAEKFKSTNADEVLLALNVLEECMSKCGTKFHSEVGKFRFLNELIRLVSPQYDGDKTPKKIRDKILDLMLLWTINFPHEKKIKDAYDMLLKRGVKHEAAKPQVVVQNNNKPISESAEVKMREKAEPDLAAKLQRLLRSSNPADHKAANLLIQNMVKEKERRHEVKMRRKLELKEITDNATLLKEMLDQLEEDQKNDSDELSEDSLDTMKYLYESCQKLQPNILILTGDTDNNECLDDALEANDLVTEVFGKYHQLLMKIRSSRNPSQNLCLISTPNASSVPSQQNGTNKNTMDELHEIFAGSSSSSTSNTSYSSLKPTTGIALTPLEPTPAIQTNESNTLDQTLQAIKNLNNATSSLDKLITPITPTASTASPTNTFGNILNNGSYTTATTPIQNAIQKASTIPSTATTAFVPEKVNATQLKFQNFDSEITQLITGLKSNLKKEPDELMLASNLDDDKLLLEDEEPLELLNEATQKSNIIDESTASESNSNDHLTTLTHASAEKPVNLNKPLADIPVDLNDIRPHDIYVPRCIMDDKSGLKIMLNFTKDKPRTDVAVLVITTTNHSSLPVMNFQFEASVPKPCKLHLKKPSGHDLPGIKPFRPPTEDITQILLISNAIAEKPLKLVCIISYNLDDDPDTVKEFFEIKDLPDLF